MGKTSCKKFSPYPFQELLPPFLAYPLRESLSQWFLFYALLFSKSVDAVQTLPNLFLLYADRAFAPASNLVPPPKLLHKVSLRGVRKTQALPQAKRLSSPKRRGSVRHSLISDISLTLPQVCIRKTCILLGIWSIISHPSMRCSFSTRTRHAHFF